MSAITDLTLIRESLKDCEEITLPYQFTKESRVKYITIKGEDEAFYEGGFYDGMGNQVVFIRNGSNRMRVPTYIRNDDGEIIYRPRFFIDPNTKSSCEEKKSELEKTVLAQQKVIQKMAGQLKLLEESKVDLQAEHYDLVNLYQDKVDEVKEFLIKEKKYRLLLSQYM
jgi:hypothetical protein